MKQFAALLAGAVALASSAAYGAVATTGTLGDTSGQTLFADFDSPATSPVPTGSNFLIVDPSAIVPGTAAPIGGDNSFFLSVLDGGTAGFTFGSATSVFSLDVGSLDPYNSITLNFSDGTSQTFQGSDLFTVAGVSPDTLPRSDERFVFTADAGQSIAGVTLASAGNSLEVDNLTVAADSAVPEPSSWAMLIAGFSLTGIAFRRRGERLIQAI